MRYAIWVNDLLQKLRSASLRVSDHESLQQPDQQRPQPSCVCAGQGTTANMQTATCVPNTTTGTLNLADVLKTSTGLDALSGRSGEVANHARKHAVAQRSLP